MQPVDFTKFKLRRVAYKVLYQAWSGMLETKDVTGYAVENPLQIKFCVCQKSDGRWHCDHWQTGFSFGGSYASKEDCAAMGIAYLHLRIEKGKWDSALEKGKKVVRDFQKQRN